MRALYPGSFDPVTFGHLDLIERASGLFDEVLVALLNNPAKNPLFTLDQRKRQLTSATAALGNVSIVSFDGLTASFALQQNCDVILRGLRAISDFERELQLAHTNQSLCNSVETLFMATSARHSFLSSSVVKEVASFGGDVSHMVPAEVATDLGRLFNQAS